MVQLLSWNTGYLYSCKYLLENGKLPINPSSPQLSWSRPHDPGPALLAKMTAQFSVSLQWVPAHVGLAGNETADRLAKIGSRAQQTQNPVTYREAKTLLHFRYNRDWKNENGEYQAHLDLVWRLERAQQTTLFRLRTGHCGPSAHLKRIGISDTSLRKWGQADQLPDHVLQSCPKYAKRHQLTWPQGADLATKLWGSAEDLYQMAGFVASTGLKIWPAWLSIAEEEDWNLCEIIGAQVLPSCSPVTFNKGQGQIRLVSKRRLQQYLSYQVWTNWFIKLMTEWMPIC